VHWLSFDLFFSLPFWYLHTLCIGCPSIYSSHYPFGIFTHCIVCSSIYLYWLPLWNLDSLHFLSFDLRFLIDPLEFSASDWPLGIFSFWLTLWYFQLLIDPLVFSAIALIVPHFTASDYPFGISFHSVICASSIYGFWFPFWYLQPLYCMFFLFMVTYCPCGILDQCIDCHSIYSFWLPLWYFQTFLRIGILYA
jgi:hypothetical protein